MSHSHKRPISRRDFLAAGTIPFAAQLLMPNWLKLLGTSPQALAAESCPSSGSNMIPFISIDLAGGAALQANFVPRDADNQPLPSYTKMGLGTQPNITTEFGDVPFVANNTRSFLAGVRLTASQSALAKTAFVAMPVRSRDDSSDNPFALGGMLQAAGLVGSQLPNTGTLNTTTGGNNKFAILPTPAPLVVKSVNDIKNSIGYAAALGSRMNLQQKSSLAKLVSGLNESQTRKIASMTDGRQVKNLLDCAGIKNSVLVGGGGTGLDLLTDPNSAIAAAWGINTSTAANNANYIHGSIVYNTLNGNAGSATIALGGYDYHGQDRAATNQKDYEAGALVGRALESANLMGRPLMLLVSTDGAVGSDSTDPNVNWDGDRGTASVAYILHFSPSGRPATRGFQIGNFTKDQVADDKTVVGSNTEVAAAAVFANYLAINKKLELFQGIVGRKLATSDLDKVLRFG